MNNKLFEGIDLSVYTEDEIKKATQLYVTILESCDEAIKNDKPLDDIIDEGILGGLIGGIAGGLAGPSIMRAVCNALGLTSGSLYNFLTSSLVTTVVGAKIGMG
jgi:uncharacterized membrane protein YeaQ/YmgE (transglycosylase-associated protein family)